MSNTSVRELKQITSSLYALCVKMWPEEFEGMYTAKREVFRDWLNEKTGLNVDHIKDKMTALSAWKDELEKIYQKENAGNIK